MWKAIDGYSKYMVSDRGEIMRVESQKILKSRPLPNGYMRVYMTADDGSRHDILIHRIVCRTFNGEPTQGKTCVNHKDCNKANNHADNLEWCNYQDNMNHASKNNLLQSQSHHMRKVNTNRRMPVNALDHAGKIRLSFLSIEDARRAGHSSVSYSIKNQAMTREGLKWELA